MLAGWKDARRFLGICSVLIVIGAACARDAADDVGADTDEPLQVTQTGLLPTFTTAWPTVIAKHQGFFEEQGLDVSFSWGFEGPQLFAGEQADILLSSSVDGLQIQAAGVDVVAFHPLATQVTVWLLARPEIRSVQDLRGKTISVSHIPSSVQFLALDFLETNGLSADDVDFVSIDEGQILPALDSGRIDATANIEDFVARQVVEGGADYTVLATGEDFGFFPFTILHATRSWIEENPDGLRGYVQAVHEATQFILDPANKDAVVAQITEESGGAVDEATVADAYEAVAANPDYYPTQPLTPAGVERAIQALEFIGDLEDRSALNVDAYLDMEAFAQAVGQG